MVKAAVVGAAGYTGIELVSLLLRHPDLEPAIVTSATDAGRAVEDLYPALAGCGLVFEDPDPVAIACAAEVAFLAVPHTAALAIAPALLEKGVKAVFDLSADFRLKEPATYEAWYDTKHTAPHLLDQAVYGLPELDRAPLEGATLVACPGCYPTATVLAAAPAIESGIAKPGRVIVDAKSGVSGAGRKATDTTHYCSADESVAPYKVGTHRHTPEIAQALSGLAGAPVAVTFTPHLVPMSRGLLSTVYLEAADGLTTADAVDAYRARYDHEPFVTVHPAGRMPATSEVRGTNRAHIGVAVDGAGMLVAACAIDNLVKGSGGQALQCANIVLGFDETAGLAVTGPVV